MKRQSRILFAFGAVLCVAWLPRPSSGTEPLVRHVDAAGEWQPDGVPLVIAPYSQDYVVVVADGQGGVIAAWTDDRNHGPLSVYMQRIDRDGQVQWETNGIKVGDYVYSRKPGLLLDGQGGVIVAWEENRLGTVTIRATRFLLDGSIAPGWPSLGRALCQDPDCQTLSETVQLVTDGSGGAYVAWSGPYCYLQRIASNGAIAPGWPADGLLVSSPSDYMRVAPDGSGGVFITCREAPRLKLLRYTSAAQPFSGWPAGGLLLGHPTGNQIYPSMVSDDSGGVVVAWDDWRGYSSIHASRVDGAGTFLPGWHEFGNELCSDCRSGSQTAGDTNIASDGSGGAFFTWSGNSAAPPRVIRIDGGGQIPLGWPAGGVVLDVQTWGFTPAVAGDGTGGALVTWSASGVARAQHMLADGSFEPSFPPQGRVLTSGHASVPLPVLSEPNVVIAVWEDSRDFYTNEWDIYAQRVWLVDQASDTGEPSALGTSLVASWPNPFTQRCTVRFDLVQAGYVHVETYDVTGRRVRTLVDGMLPPGPHSIHWNGLDDYQRRQPAGIYFLRVRWPGVDAASKVLLVP